MSSYYRIGIDTGGTFTDVVLADDQGRMLIGKALTTKEKISQGMLEAIGVAAEQLGASTADVLAKTQLLIYGSTRATNAILEEKTARTALIVTEGFPDVLVRREGGKENPWDFTQPFPEPYVPRRQTFELPERMTAEGEIFKPFDEAAALEIISRLRQENIEAVAVCLLWSMVNPAHEERFGALLEQHMPGVPYTLSSRLNPVIREYRRASAAAIDASLKPLMQEHLREMETDLQAAGFRGDLLPATSLGGVAAVGDVIERPILMVRSGPALGPVLGAAYAEAETGDQNVIVCDTGGTSFDVSLVRDGRPVRSRETWLGGRYSGHLTGLSAVDARSVGSGGGSIAWVDAGGLLQVGPESAGAMPGPACYGRGGDRATVTDAAVVLGYLDPDYFLGGRMALDVKAARQVVGGIADRLGCSLHEAAYGIMTIASEHMVEATKEITINEGVDPRDSLIIAGGGAGGLNLVLIARELGCKRLLFPRTAGVLCACGAQFSDIAREWSASRVMRSDRFDLAEAGEVLDHLRGEMAAFEQTFENWRVEGFRQEFIVEARYLGQVWEIEIPLQSDLKTQQDVEALIAQFHDAHEAIFAIRDANEVIEFMQWRARMTAQLKKPAMEAVLEGGAQEPAAAKRISTYFRETGEVEIPVYQGETLKPGMRIEGPALIAEPTTTIVLHAGSEARVTALGNHMVEIDV
ncbi:hydantoinase/oxoprolinase family protein [Hyphococcus luteus]|uniref:5-oxoprolinase n=1 Tax=Hyphococcus luteus TaxID=2058213 RepID=A0A2S7K214_9PROT|nr:hydantoinase/oxoprolinase family protein [Marinicaulis flavus]PQA86542.1 5-oxoprolinase [Marinicaulis flavus]